MMLPLRILIHTSACVIFIVGKLCVDLMGDFNDAPFSMGNNTYYVWDKLCYLLLTLCVIFPCRDLKYLFYMMGGLMLVRLLDEIPCIRDWQWWENVHGMIWVDMIAFVWMFLVMYYNALKKIKTVQKELKQGIPKPTPRSSNSSAIFV